MADLLTQARNEARARNSYAKSRAGHHQYVTDLMTQLCDEIEKLRGALKPFAEAAEDLDDNHPPQADIWESSAALDITATDLRKARVMLMLSEISPKRPEDG